MILDNNAINSVDPNLALGHKDWISRFTAIPQADQAKENEQMADILGLLPTDNSCDESKMVALINNEETTIFLGLDSSGKSINEDESANDGALTDKEKDPLAETEPVQHPKTGEHTDDPILDSSDDEAYTTARQPPAAANPKSTTPPKEAEIAVDTPIPKKAAKPSSFRKCKTTME
jgi:hypothetical protein